MLSQPGVLCPIDILQSMQGILLYVVGLPMSISTQHASLNASGEQLLSNSVNILANFSSAGTSAFN